MTSTNRTKRWVLAFVVVLGGVFAGPSPVWAHGGSGHQNLTSNYRTQITDVTPDVDGVEVAIVDVDGTLRVTYRGSGEMVVVGYEDEPYLRVDQTGASVNTRSPATYLNRDRFANSEVPVTADASATPTWERLDGGGSVEWHDHRNHWMSPVPPPETAVSPDQTFAIKRWEIPLIVDGRDVVVVGELAWVPPPSPALPLLLGGLGAALLVGLLWTRWWRVVAVGVAAVGAAAFTIDTAGSAGASVDTMANRAWMFLWPAAATLAVWRLIVLARRRVEFPPLALGSGGLVLVMMGGVSRRDVLSRSQVFSSIDPIVARWCITVAFAVGLALTIRFTVFIVALLVDRDHPAALPTVVPTVPEVRP